MKCISACLAVAVSLITCNGLFAGDKPRKPNILFIAVDDLRPALGCYGNSVVKSPNIDKLARRGVRFEHAYCQYPLCNPSRTSLLTGRQPTTTKVLDNLTWFRDQNPDWVSLPQHFRANGYVTLRVGKIFHGGIDDEKAWVKGGEPLKPRKPRTPAEQEKYRKLSDRWLAVEEKVDTLPDHQNATRAIELLEKHRGEPFFLALGFSRPHSPLIAPKKHFESYDPKTIKLPIDFAAKPTVGKGVPVEALPPINGDLFSAREATEAQAKEMIAAYYACVSFIDAEIGRVLDALERLGLADNTVVVFFGDHGYHLGEKGKWSKHNSLYEVGTRVPMMVAAPKAPANGKSSTRPVQLLDLYPTLTELAGLPQPKGLEGHSVAPLLKDPGANWAHAAFTVTKRGKIFGRSIRTERFRYTEWDDAGKKAELYDHENDPHEMNNLAHDPGRARTIGELRQRLSRELPALAK
jgi:iduronate 2-sulfatase